MTATRPVRLIRRFALAGTVAALVGSAAACGSATPGAAAVVDGRRISVAEVQDATPQLQSYFAAQSSTDTIVPSKVLYYLIIGPQVLDAAAQAGLAVSANDARNELATTVASPSSGAVTYLQTYAAVNRIVTQVQAEDAKVKPIYEQLVANLQKESVEVNPRYGSFDAANISLVAATQNWVVPSASPSPSPSAS